ncbi:hypothetical protein [Zoogloea sp. 1C4]|uniref:hypothetical protein n=1 Tax=Zoogloea sp. 1C4 TaxID=2570190 RepID=UPI001290CF7E|nr:hypothetical protein [Zoogloea sp. 1C4]
MNADSRSVKPFVLFFLLLSFFGPYYPGTSFRLDQIIGWIYICALFVLPLFAGGVFRIERQYETKVFALGVGMLLFVLFRIFVDLSNLSGALQLANQFSLIVFGCALYYFHRVYLSIEWRSFVIAFLLVSIFINAYAIYQFADTDSPFVTLVFDYYGGKEEGRYEDFRTLAELSVRGGGRFTSIFSGMHSLGIYNLLTLSVCVGAAVSKKEFPRHFYIVTFALALSIVGGVLSTSKTYYFGALIILIINFATVGLKLTKFHLYAFLVIGAAAFLVIFLAEDLPMVSRPFLLLFGDSGHGVSDIFSSRFGASDTTGYFDNVVDVTSQFSTWVLGFGDQAFDYKYADFEYRQILLVGGAGLLMLFYGFCVYITYLNYLSIRTGSPFSRPFLGLSIAFLIAGVGMPVHLQARIIPLWVLLNLLLASPVSMALKKTNSTLRG